MKWLNRWRNRNASHDATTHDEDEAPLCVGEDPFTEPVVWEITDTLDLHHVTPSDMRAVVAAFLEEARARGFLRLRIIHGKGIGAQRANVRQWLAETPFVSEFFDAPDASGWGATVVILQKNKHSDDG